jgi:SRSO17 transposase
MLEATFMIDWQGRFAGLMDRLRPRFSRKDLRQRAEHYLRGLLSQVGRKNSWQLAEAVGADTPHGFQRLLGRAQWDTDEVRNDLQSYVMDHVGDAHGVLIVDETGFLKKGDKSAGVGRQYSGTAGRIENCQIGVFLAYRSKWGHALIDRELYLPKAWTEDRDRCEDAGIPAETAFATKPALARRMLRRAWDAGLEARWVTADEVYGGDSKFRQLLEKQGMGYVVAVSCQQRLCLHGSYDRVDRHAQKMPPRKWKKLSCGAGAKGERLYEWAFVPFGVPTEHARRKGFLVRRSLKNPDERAYYLTHATKGTRVAQLVRVAGARWAIEECFEQAKQETGLDEYEVRGWTGWYRHITLSMFAHAFLSAVRAAPRPRAEGKKRKSLPASSHSQCRKSAACSGSSL